MVSGSTSTAIKRPPRRSDTVSAAPIAPIMVSAGVPAASVAATSASGSGVIASIRPNSGLTTISGSALAVQWAAHLTSTTASSGSAPVDDHVERAVFLIGLEQPVEPEQGREQRRDPEDRWPEPRQELEIGPEREGHERDEDEEEHRADRRPAADSTRDPPFAEKRARAGHAARSSGASRPSRGGMR